MRVLVVEDDALLGQHVEMLLSTDGCSVHRTVSGEEAVDLGKLYAYDLIVLDVSLPDMSGIEVVRRLRAANVGTPILMLSGDLEVATKVRSLSAGADDYLTKPFHRGELLARVRAIVRRSNGHAQSLIKIGDVTVDLDAKVANVHGKRVPLSSKEYQILELLSLRKGVTLTKAVFLNHLYGGMDEPDPKIIDVFVCKLRKKLMTAGDSGNHIQTVWGRGYMLQDPDEYDHRVAA
jgi:two-component system, cell cycle response regulator CtrA